MSLFNQLFASAFCLVLFSWVLYLIFGQVSVRKLRKNPETKHALGVELVSGWDIFNVAGALSRPQWLSEKFKASRLSGLAADADVLYRHTTRFDRFLGRLFFFSSVISSILILIFSLLSLFGVFE